MLLNCIEKRFSVRKFLDKPVEQEKIDILIEAARLAPSASNKQTWHFVVIRDKEKRKQLTDICRGQKAPVIDGAIAAEHIVLQAVELGLGSCWIGAFYHDKMAELINLPQDYEIIGLLPVGYPAVEKGNRDLKSIEEVVSYDSF